MLNDAIVICFQVDSFCKAEELPLSPDDEVIIQSVTRGKRSTFELEQPSVNRQSKQSVNAVKAKS